MQQAFDDFIAVRKKLKSRTLYDYQRIMKTVFADWQNKAMLKINKDMVAKTLKVTDTKNHQGHTLPLSDFLFDLLQQRKSNAINDYVFQRANGTGYISEQRKQTGKIIKESGVSFTIHDLRRTFVTVAESLNISAYAVKRLVNHKMSNDITAGYIVTDVERLSQPMQKITDYMLKCAGYKPSATVTDLNQIQFNRIS